MCNDDGNLTDTGIVEPAHRDGERIKEKDPCLPCTLEVPLTAPHGSAGLDEAERGSKRAGNRWVARARTLESGRPGLRSCSVTD